MAQVHDLQTAKISTNFLERIDILTEHGQSYVILRTDMGNLRIWITTCHSPGYDDPENARLAKAQIRNSIARAIHSDANYNPQLRSKV